LKQHPGLLLLLVNGFHDLVLLHQVCFLHENIFCSKSKLLGLSGSPAEADVFLIDPVGALVDFETAVSVWCNLKSVTSADNQVLLAISDQNPPVFCGKASLVAPPLVLIAILEAKNLCPAALIPFLSTKFQEFDRSSTQAKACTLLHSVLEFLWAVSEKLVPPSVVAVDSSTNGLD